MPPLLGVRARLDRAQEQIDTLDQETQRWLRGDPYETVDEVDLERGEYRLRLRELDRPDFLRWGVIAGECIHNFRASLDNLAYELTVHETRQDPPPNADSIYFPIFSDPDRYVAEGKRKIGDIGKCVERAIETMQPYNRGNDPDLKGVQGLHPLWLVYELSNSDKHKVVSVVTAAIKRATMALRVTDLAIHQLRDRSGVMTQFLGPPMTGLQDGSELAYARFTVTGPQPSIYMDGEFSYVVTLDRKGPAFGHDLIPTLREISDYFRLAVLPRIAAAL